MPLSDEQHAAVDGFLAEYAPDDAPLVKAILTAGEQSTGDPAAVSPKDARGLMQLTPDALIDTGRDPKTFDYNSPVESIKAGADYVRVLRDRYGFTNPLQIAAAYNAGPGQVHHAVAQGGIDYLPAETRGYVARMAAVLGPDAAPSGDAPALAPAAYAPPDPRMPRVTEALAGEGVPPRPDALTQLLGPTLAGVLAGPGLTQPGEVPDLLAPTRAEGAARMSPEGFAKMDVAAPLVLPGAATFTGAAATGGGYAGLDQTIQRIRSKGIAHLDATDFRDIGRAVLEGAGVGLAMHGVANLIFGKPAPERRQAEDVLTQSGGPLGIPQRPPVPVDAPSQAALSGRVEDVIGTTIPTATTPQVTDAYDAFKAETHGRPLNVTKYNETLQHYGGEEFPKARQAAPDRLFEPVGSPVRTYNRAGQVTGTQWFTTAEDLLKSENGIAFAARAKDVAGEPNIQSGLMKAMRGDLQGSLTHALTGTEAEALASARALSAEFHQAIEAHKLLNGARDAQGIINPSGLAKKLVDRPEFYRNELGDTLYDQMTTLTQAGDTLSKQPGGRQVFGQLAIRAIGGLAGYLGGTPYGTGTGVAGAIGGAALGPRLLGPYAMRIVEGIARSRGTAGAVPEAVGRLAVAFSMDEPTPPPAHSIDGLLTASGAP